MNQLSQNQPENDSVVSSILIYKEISIYAEDVKVEREGVLKSIDGNVQRFENQYLS